MNLAILYGTILGLSQDVFYLWGERVSFQCLSQTILAIKLLVLWEIELYVKFIMLDLFSYIFITYIYLSLKRRVFFSFLKLHQDHSSYCINFTLIYLDLRRKNRSCSTDYKLLSLIFKLIVILPNLIRIRSPESFKWNDVITLKSNLNIMWDREKVKIKLLKNVFFNIWIVNGTEIVKSFNVF